MAQRLRGPAAYLRAAVGRAGDGAPHDQAWCMAFLFFLSGYLALPSLARKGAGPYHVDRLRRFGIPIIVYLFGISPVVTWLVLAAHPGIHPSLLVYWRSAYLSLATIDTGPLWFIWALLLMDVLLVAVARWLRRADLGARPGGTFPTRWRLAAFALALGLTAFVVRLHPRRRHGSVWPPDRVLPQLRRHVRPWPRRVASALAGRDSRRRLPVRAVGSDRRRRCVALHSRPWPRDGLQRRRRVRRGLAVAGLGVRALGAVDARRYVDRPAALGTAAPQPSLGPVAGLGRCLIPLRVRRWRRPPLAGGRGRRRAVPRTAPPASPAHPSVTFPRRHPWPLGTTTSRRWRS